jgi:hypothetical protein
MIDQDGDRLDSGQVWKDRELACVPQAQAGE